MAATGRTALNLPTFKPANLQTCKPSNLQTFKPVNFPTCQPISITLLEILPMNWYDGLAMVRFRQHTY